MKILELTNYSAGGCGVFARVKEEAKLLSKKGHEVMIFSSNIEKGTNRTVPEKDNLDNVRIRRFPGKKLGGEGFLNWKFEKEALNFNPNVIIAHSYRQLHTTRALKIAKKLGSKIFLVTHAPFDRSSTRSLLARIIVTIYDFTIGPLTINRFDKIIAITHWEKPYLESLGAKKSKIVYIPNGVREKFFSVKKLKGAKNKIIYTGRIVPIKSLETVSRALCYEIPNKHITFETFGPAEADYLKSVDILKNHPHNSNNIKIIDKIYNIDEQIKELDSGEIFILPSKSEGMPQVLIEAMARGRIIFASDNKGNSDLVKDGKNGFLFRNGDSKDLARVINKILAMKSHELVKIKNEARETAEQFRWSKIIDRLDKIIRS